MLELLTEQVVGYYDPATKVLYVVDGAEPAMVNVTVTHELVHALQDQYLNLDSIQKITATTIVRSRRRRSLKGRRRTSRCSRCSGSSSTCCGFERPAAGNASAT